MATYNNIEIDKRLPQRVVLTDPDGNIVPMSGGVVPVSGGGGGGGAATIADGADVVEGSLADAAITTNAAGTVSGKLRGIVALLAAKIGVTIADGDSATLGVTTGAAVTTNASGTVQQYLRGLVTLIVAKIGVTIADGDAATIGITTGAAVTTNATGTVQQYLRGLVTLIIAKIGITIADGDAATLGVTTGAAVITNANGTVQQYLRGLVTLALSGFTAIGNVAAGASDSGNPVKIGLIYNTSPPAITNGQRGNVQGDSTAGLIVNPKPLSLSFDYVNAAPYYNASSGTASTVSVTTGGQTLLSSNADRKGAAFYNDGAVSVYIGLFAACTATAFTYLMPASGYFETPFGYTGIITAITGSSTANVRITEVAP